MGNICDCGDPQSMHRASKYGCRHVDCVCAKFSLDIQATKKAKADADHGAVEAMVDRDHADLGGHVEPDAAGDDGEPELPSLAIEVAPEDRKFNADALSTSARLAKAEEERDAARTEIVGVRELLDLALVERDHALARVRELEQDIDPDTGEHRLAYHANLYHEVKADLAKVIASRDLVQAELASARQEIDRLIAQQGDVRQAAEEKVQAALAGQPPHLATALAEAMTEVDNLRISRKLLQQQLDEAQAQEDTLRKQRDSMAGELAEARGVIEAIEEDRPGLTADTGQVIDSYTRWFCQPVTGCGEHYEIPQDDNYCACGKQLLAVTVTAAITL